MSDIEKQIELFPSLSGDMIKEPCRCKSSACWGIYAWQLRSIARKFQLCEHLLVNWYVCLWKRPQMNDLDGYGNDILLKRRENYCNTMSRDLQYFTFPLFFFFLPLLSFNTQNNLTLIRKCLENLKIYIQFHSVHYNVEMATFTCST